MSFARGERVHFDFDSGGITGPVEPAKKAVTLPLPPKPVAFDFVGDILERPACEAKPPVAPTFKPSTSGFPSHKKRTPKGSAFKQRRHAQAHKETAQSAALQVQAANPPQGVRMSAEDERRQIDKENWQRLAAMSEEEIEEEKRELLEGLSPRLIQKLLGRASLDDGRNEMDWEEKKEEDAAVAGDKQQKTSKQVSFAEEEGEDTQLHNQPLEKSELALPTEPSNSTPPSTSPETPSEPHPSMHFPTPPQPPDLDPSDPNFLTTLHQKYFPHLPHSPSTLSWLQPLDPTDTTSPYHPSHTTYAPQDLRFDFTGALLAPSTARSLPVTKGLHHHADAPEAAGYTISELAVTARSAVPAQRCVAYQTLGRILYRLGRGEFGFERVRRKTGGPVGVARMPPMEAPVVAEDGEEEEVDEDEVEVDMQDVGSAMAAGLWGCVEEGRVVETLVEEAGRERGHLTARTYAQEALWNWRRGGGRRRQAV